MHRSGVGRPGSGPVSPTCSLCGCVSVIPLSRPQCSLQGLLAFMSLKQFSEDAYRRQRAKWLVQPSGFSGVRICSVGGERQGALGFLFVT